MDWIYGAFDMIELMNEQKDNAKIVKRVGGVLTNIYISNIFPSYLYNFMKIGV